MTPEQAVRNLVSIVTSSAEISEDAIYDGMAAAGMSAAIADRTYKFALIAFGQAFLSGLGVHFSKQYMYFNAQGEIVERGELANEPHFKEAVRIAGEVRDPSLMRFALLSADVQAVNEALNAGSEPHNLQLAPAVLFTEPPTQAGLDRAGRVAAEAFNAQPPKARKAWWRFW